MASSVFCISLSVCSVTSVAKNMKIERVDLYTISMPLVSPFGGLTHRGQSHERPVQAAAVKLDHKELTFGDYTKLVVGWLKKNPW